MKLQLVVLCCAAVAAVATARSPFNLGRWARRESDALHLKPKLKEVEGAAKDALDDLGQKIHSLIPTAQIGHLKKAVAKLFGDCERKDEPAADFVRLKCHMYERLRSCFSTGGLENAWACLTTKCGPGVERVVKTVETDLLETPCWDSTTPGGKLGCVFWQLLQATQCGHLTRLCSAHPFHRVQRRDGLPVCSVAAAEPPRSHPAEEEEQRPGTRVRRDAALEALANMQHIMKAVIKA